MILTNFSYKFKQPCVAGGRHLEQHGLGVYPSVVLFLLSPGLLEVCWYICASVYVYG